jgi:hypothetical protein
MMLTPLRHICKGQFYNEVNIAPQIKYLLTVLCFVKIYDLKSK